MTVKTGETRERILDTAGKMFYEQGYQAVGIDTIIRETGIAKMTLYNHFSSKSELIVAYLERTGNEFLKWLDEGLSGKGKAEDRIIDVFQSLEKMASAPSCKGCPFILAASEFPDLKSPEHAVSRKHKDEVYKRLLKIAKETKAGSPEMLASHLLLLMDGIFASVRMFGTKNHSSSVTNACRSLLKCYQKKDMSS